jgi:hypothetical protein
MLGCDDCYAGGGGWDDEFIGSIYAVILCLLYRFPYDRTQLVYFCFSISTSVGSTTLSSAIIFSVTKTTTRNAPSGLHILRTNGRIIFQGMNEAERGEAVV